MYSYYTVQGRARKRCKLRLVHTELLRYHHHKNATLTGKMGMQPILTVTVPIRKIKGAARQQYVDVTVSLGVNRPLRCKMKLQHSITQVICSESRFCAV